MDSRGKTILSLIEMEMSKQDIKDIIAQGDDRVLTFTSGLEVRLRGLKNIGMLEATLVEQGQSPHVRLFSKMNFGILH